MEAPQFEGHASRDSTFLVPGYVHADRGKSKGNGRVPHSEQSQPPVREIDFTELEDGSLVELVEDPSDSDRTLLAVYKDGQVSYTGRLEHEGQVLVPLTSSAPPSYARVCRSECRGEMPSRQRQRNRRTPFCPASFPSKARKSLPQRYSKPSRFLGPQTALVFS